MRPYKDTINETPPVVTLAKVLLLCLILTACIQTFNADVTRYADKSALMVTESTLTKINRTFYGNLSNGDWTYEGANARAGVVNAYIKIPQQLNLKPEIQVQYLHDIVCPAQEELALWREMKHVDLSVHVYTKKKSKSISATCTNPLKKRA